MYRVALCEDNTHDQAIMTAGIKKAFASFSRACDLCCFSSGEEFLANLDPYSFDLAFFDVEMKLIDGIETARRLREIDKSVVIVFTTVHATGVFSSFSAEPLHYLVKPVQPELLEGVVEAALRKIDEQRKEQLAFSFNGVVHSVPVGRIRFLESKERTVEVATGSTRLRFYGTLNKVQQDPLLSSFIRCHQSFLVNPTFIKQIGVDSVLLFSGETIALSRKRAKEAKERLLSHVADALP